MTSRGARLPAALPMLVGLGLLIGIGIGPCEAADWSFQPVLEMGAEQTDNVLTSAREIEESDTAYTVALSLGLTRVSPRSETVLTYRPVHESYDEFSELDNTAHDVLLRWDHQPSRRWDLAADAGWTRRERARVLFDEPSLDLVALPRTRFDALRGGVSADVRTGHHSALNLTARHVRTSYDQAELAPGGLRLEDTSATTLALGFDHLFSQRKRAGVELDVTRSDDGFRGEVDAYGLSGVYRWTGRGDLTVTGRLGAAQTSSRGPGVDAQGEPLPETDDQVYLIGGLDVSGPLSRRTTLTGGISRDISTGSGVSATVETLSGFLAWDVRLRRYSGLALFARYSQRDELERVEEAATPYPAADTTSLRAEWRAALARTWRLVVSAERFDQSSEQEILNVDYTIYSASVRWTPMAGRE